MHMFVFISVKQRNLAEMNGMLETGSIKGSKYDFLNAFSCNKDIYESRPLCACFRLYVRELKLYLHTDCTVFTVHQ